MLNPAQRRTAVFVVLALVVLATASFLVGCSAPQPVVYQQPAPAQQVVAQPVYVQQQPNPVGGFFGGLFIGHLLGGIGAGSHTTYVHHTTTVVRPRYYGAPYTSRTFSRSYSSRSFGRR